MGKDAIPCGHTLADLIGGTEHLSDGTTRPSAATCGACLALRQDEIATRRKSGHTLAAAERAFLQANAWQPVTAPGMTHLWSRADNDGGFTQANTQTAIAITRREIP